MNMIKLYGKPIRVNKASAHQKNLDVGANIFIGNLDPEVDEKLLYDTFSAFGVILTTPKVLTSFSIVKVLLIVMLFFVRSKETWRAATLRASPSSTTPLSTPPTRPSRPWTVSTSATAPSPSRTPSRRTPRASATGRRRRGSWRRPRPRPWHYGLAILWRCGEFREHWF